MNDRLGRLVVEGHDRTADGVADLDRWCDVARRTLLDEGVAAGTLDLLFVDGSEMASLNERFMQSSGPTDVLAFPLDGPEAAGGHSEPCRPGAAAVDGQPPLHLGDVVVCPSVARRQAPGHTGGYDSELTLLVVHGVLHVLGHDHAEPAEARAMVGRERHHLGRHGFSHPVAV